MKAYLLSLFSFFTISLSINTNNLRHDGILNKEVLDIDVTKSEGLQLLQVREAPSSAGSCEFCMKFVHQVQYGSFPSCTFSPRSSTFVTCQNVVDTLKLHSKEILLLIKDGCFEYNPYVGWQAIVPCPAHVICGRLPVKYNPDKAIVPHCPPDYHFRFPDGLIDERPKFDDPLILFAAQQLKNNNLLLNN